MRRVWKSKRYRFDFNLRIALRLVPILGCLLLPGCSADKPPQQNAATQPVQADAASAENEPAVDITEETASNPILPGSDEWTHEEAVATLAEESACVSAALRLAHLAELEPYAELTPMPIAVAERLRVFSLDDEWRVLGLRTDDEQILAAPVMIDSAGAASYPIVDTELEWTFLHRSDDAELFPHLLFTEDCMWMWGEDEWSPALTVQQPACLHFEKRTEKGRPSIVLLWLRSENHAAEQSSDPDNPSDEEAIDDAPYAEVARYFWDPFELDFSGPLCDKLPDPPGGQFELDLQLSPALIPVGGLIPEPPKIEPRRAIPKEKPLPPY